jgi:uncharacterized protein YhbP (UPF0306 family)
MLSDTQSLGSLFLLPAMTIASVSASGETHAAMVYFAATFPADLVAALGTGTIGVLKLYFFSDPHSQHGQDLVVHPGCAVAISTEASSWQEIRGLQLRGEARRLPRGKEWQAGWKCYQAKFPFVSALKPLLSRNALYIFLPTWVRLVDNRRGFGFKQEWTLA